MDGTTTDIVLVVLLLVGMALFALAMFALALRVGPKRGSWNQPAAALVQPGRGLMIAMYVFGAAHVALGLVAALAFEGGGIGVFLVLLAMGAFYVLCAHAWSLAHVFSRRRDRTADPAA